MHLGAYATKGDDYCTRYAYSRMITLKLKHQNNSLSLVSFVHIIEVVEIAVLCVKKHRESEG